MLVLAIDTSSSAVTIAVVSLESDGAVFPIAQRCEVAPRGHTELLGPCIREVLEESGMGPRDVRAVVAGTGPGPFTGLRVGLVTAAAFADAVGVFTYGVCSLDAIGTACADEPDLLVATDARRREVYWARYRSGVRDGEVQVDAPAEVPLEGVGAIAGAGAELYDWPGVPHRSEHHPDPVVLVGLARIRVQMGEPPEPLTPMYLRRPDAVPGAPKRVRQ